MKTLPAAVTTEIAKSAVRPITLYELTLLTTDPILGTNTGRFAEYDKDVHFNNALYTAFPISHDTIRSGVEYVVESVKVVVGVENGLIIGLLARHDGLRSARMTIMTVFEGLLDVATNKIINFEGYISHAQVNEEVAAIEVTSILDVQDIRLPRRSYRRDRCSWIYKNSTTCQYAGLLPSCDKAFEGPNGCRAHDNTLRFGGFPLVPARKSSIL